METRVLIHEAIAGGGLAAESLPDGLLAEGRLMLEGLLLDAAALPGIRVVTTRDARVPAAGWPDVETHVVDPHTPVDPILDHLLRTAHAALVVAPETGGALERLARRVARLVPFSLGSTPAAIRVAGDKGATADALRAAGLATPRGRTVPADPKAVASAAADLGYPVVVKPVDGAGAVATVRVAHPADLEAALAHVAERAVPEALGGRAVRLRIERWVHGAAASVAVVADGRRAVPLALNGQHVVVEADGRVTYTGGETPLAHPGRDDAFEAAARAVGAIPGLAGFVGVDLVLPVGARPVVVEVNPRVTTAYAGLRLVSPTNLVGLILSSCRGRRLPDGPLALEGRAVWRGGRARVAGADAA